MTVVTLLTDFGLKDGNVGVMKGVIWNVAPEAQIVDISHGIGPQNVAEAALILLRAGPYFPPGTIHVSVVDPGVGTKRRPIAARIGDWFFVCPDNGILTMLLERAEQEGWYTELVHLDKPQFWLPKVSQVFHGRDVFAPVAGALARGLSLAELGTPIKDAVRLKLPKPVQTKAGWQGEVIHIDHFGNLAANIREEQLGAGQGGLKVRIGNAEIKGLVGTFGEKKPGELVALIGSTGNLIVAVVNGNAAEKLGAKVGDEISVEK